MENSEYTPQTDGTDGATPMAASDSAIHRRRRWVVVGLLLVIAGWVFMMFYPWVSIGCTLAGLIVSIIGVRIPPGPRRDIATTAIVAASVLLIVFALFATILYLI